MVKNNSLVYSKSWHPYLFGIYPVLFLYGYNITQISLRELLLPLFLILIFTLIFVSITNFFSRDIYKTGIIVSGFLVFIFSYVHFFDLATQYFDITFQQKNRYLLWSGAFLIFSFIVIISLIKSNLKNLTVILNLIALILVLIPLIRIGLYSIKSNIRSGNIKVPENIENNNSGYKIKSLESKRDIYYIIFDRYGSEKSLKKYYNTDISGFTSELRKRGFYIASDSKANYQGTDYSLVSSLNLDYLGNIDRRFSGNATDMKPLYALLRDYKVWHYLKDAGYSFIHFGSIWQPTSKNNNADMNFNIGSTEDFKLALYKTTYIYNLGVEWGIYDYRIQQKKNILYEFGKLGEMPLIKKTKFVFAHMLIPHPPYVFDNNGNFLDENVVDNRPRVENYRNSVLFANKKILQLVDKLISRSEIKPIIIIQGDEGPYPERYENMGKEFQWLKATKEELDEKMRIFNAYYLPGKETNLLYSNISPVNSFRLIFNMYFNTNYKLLQDKSYFTPDNKKPFEFQEIK
ncbi:MAG: hypothetical protein Q8880_07290 [Bacteroidota bacterium]|nr:hypothetical protein [Bacteroidota bacterium]